MTWCGRNFYEKQIECAFPECKATFKKAIQFDHHYHTVHIRTVEMTIRQNDAGPGKPVSNEESEPLAPVKCSELHLHGKLIQEYVFQPEGSYTEECAPCTYHYCPQLAT
jgi:hypothetical protein